MSYQSPLGYSPQYGFMPYYFTPPDQLLAPARRASWMLLSLGMLVLLGSSCAGLVIYNVNEVELVKVIDQVRATDPRGAEVMTPQLLRVTIGVLSVILALCGIVGVILGMVVRGGSRAAAITAIVLVALAVLAMCGHVLIAATAGAAAVAGTLMIYIVPFVLLGLTIVLLYQAAAAAPRVEAARQQLQLMQHQQAAQYYAYAQQQQQQQAPSDPPPAV